MTENKTKLSFGIGKDENGNEFNFVEFPCPSCKTATITLPTTKKEKEFMTFKCGACGSFQYFEKPATPGDQDQ